MLCGYVRRIREKSLFGSRDPGDDVGVSRSTYSSRNSDTNYRYFHRRMHVSDQLGVWYGGVAGESPELAGRCCYDGERGEAEHKHQESGKRGAAGDGARGPSEDLDEGIARWCSEGGVDVADAVENCD